MKNTESLGKLLSVLGKYRYIALVIAAGVVLLLIPASGGGEAKTIGAAEEYTFNLTEEEKRLEKALGEAEGVGRVRVVLTLKEGGEYVYEKDVQESGRISGGGSLKDEYESGTKTVVVSKGSGIQEPVAVKWILPRYQGALIVCDGAGSSRVELEIISAVRSVTGLSSDRITVIRMKSG